MCIRLRHNEKYIEALLDPTLDPIQRLRRAQGSRILFLRRNEIPLLLPQNRKECL